MAKKGGRPTDAERKAKILRERAEAKEQEMLDKAEERSITQKIQEVKVEQNNNVEPINIKKLDKELLENSNIQINNNTAEQMPESQQTQQSTNIEDTTKVDPALENRPQFKLPDEDMDLERDKVIDNDAAEEQIIGSYNPLEDGVEDHPYTKGTQTAQPLVNGQPAIEPFIAEPVIKIPPIIDTNTNFNGGGNGNNNNNNNSGNPQNNNGLGGSTNGTGNINPTPPTPPSPVKEPVNPDLGGMSAAQQRKQAEIAADALIKTYAKFLPVLPKKLASVNMRKLDRMEMNDQIDTNCQILEDGTTIRTFFEGVNEQVESTFVVTPAMQEELKEPLIAVLLENKIALTPTQQLVMVVGGHVLQMGASTIQFMQTNKNAMKDFQRFHSENKEMRSIISNTAKHSTQYSAHKAQEAQAKMEMNDLERENKEMREAREIQEVENQKIKARERDFAENNKTDNSEKIVVDQVIANSNIITDVKFTEIKTNKLKVDDVLTEQNGGITISEEVE